MRYYNDKAYFDKIIAGRYVRARTACVVLRYVVNGETYVLTIKERPNKNIIEFPGGKVESSDSDIYDTCFREVWEEIILKDQFNGRRLHNWHSIRKQIMESDHSDAVLCQKIYGALHTCKVSTYGSQPLKTVYFIIDVSIQDAEYLIKTHNMIPISTEMLDYVVQYNKQNYRRSYRNKSWARNTNYEDPRFHRKRTHFCSGAEIYKLRGRDFDGMFQFVSML